MGYETNPKHFALLEAEAFSILGVLERSDELDLRDLTKKLEITLEYMLCDLFYQHELGRGFWVDGVVFDSVELALGPTVSMSGFAWCADDRNQWHVPAQTQIRFHDRKPRRVDSVTIRVGDATLESLEGHKSEGAARVPSSHEWLLEFRLHATESPT